MIRILLAQLGRRPPSKRRAKICRYCGTEFFVKPSHYDKKAYCGRLCMTEDYKTRWLGDQNPHWSNARHKLCQYCRQAYQANHQQRKYCSKACYGAAQAEKARERPPRPRVRHDKPKPRKPRQLVFAFIGRPGRKRTRLRKLCLLCRCPFLLKRGLQKYCSPCGILQRSCVICGQSFTLYRSKGSYVCCSPACARQWKSERQRGDRSHRWQGGKTAEAILRRTSYRYDDWRKAVFTRDDYTCALCGERGGKLCVHHIYRFVLYPELAYEISNGITLCWECHHSIHHKEEAYAPRFMAFLVGHTSLLA